MGLLPAGCIQPDPPTPSAAYPATPAAPYAATSPAPYVAAATGPAAPASEPSDVPVYRPDSEGRPTEILRDDAPNRRYASMAAAACEIELVRRGVPFVRGEATPGVAAPIRLRGPLRGVSIHSALNAAARESSPMEIFDCRLVLALDDFAALANTRGITEMVHFGAYRPKSAHGCTPKYDGLQHCGGLAVDVGSFRRSDGTAWSVEKDFHGKIGTATCGSTAHPLSSTPASQGLWSLVCDSAARGIFHVILTPNHNQEHFNHLHLEVTPGADWMLIH
jgi:hypothetical protein